MSHHTTVPRRAAWLAPWLLAAAAPVLAGDGVAALAYAGGEALPPEAEARLLALTTVPGGLHSRDEVRRQLAAARDDGTLAEAGEVAEPAHVLLARQQANVRQAQSILAAQEAAARQRLAALEAEARPSAPPPATPLAQAAGDGPASVREMPEPPVAAAPRVQMAAERPVAPQASGDRVDDDPPSDRPSDAPSRDDRPALAPLEVPFARPPEPQASARVDPD
jgi:hypothetical protein